MAVTGKPLARTGRPASRDDDFSEGRQRRRCRRGDDRRRLHDVGHAVVGRRDAGLIYDPHTKKVIGINALGVAPTGATPEFFHSKGMRYPPDYGPLAAVTPGTPGGIMTMVAEYGKLSLKDVLAPAIEMADGYPIEAQSANTIEKQSRQAQRTGRTRASSS
jgi:gamma-glutamyltranspeptidase/glutathione hydrolase